VSSELAAGALLQHRKWTAAQLGAVDEHGNTALLLAALKGHVKIAELLLASGANGRAVNGNGNNAWQINSFFCATGRVFVDAIFKHVDSRFIDEQAPNGRNALMLTGARVRVRVCMSDERPEYVRMRFVRAPTRVSCARIMVEARVWGASSSLLLAELHLLHCH
jgi:hypothetical protein